MSKLDISKHYTLDILFSFQKLINASVKRTMDEINTVEGEEDEVEDQISDLVKLELTKMFEEIQNYIIFENKEAEPEKEEKEYHTKEVNMEADEEEEKPEIERRELEIQTEVIEIEEVQEEDNDMSLMFLELEKIQTKYRQEEVLLRTLGDKNQSEIETELAEIKLQIEQSKRTLRKFEKILKENLNYQPIEYNERGAQTQKEVKIPRPLELQTSKLLTITKTYLPERHTSKQLEIIKPRKEYSQSNFQIHEIKQHWLDKVVISPVKNQSKKIRPPSTQQLICQVSIIGENTIIKKSQFNANEIQRRKKFFKDMSQVEGLSTIVRLTNGKVVVGGFDKAIYFLNQDLELDSTLVLQDRVVSGILSNDKIYMALNNKQIDVFETNTMSKVSTVFTKTSINHLVEAGDNHIMVAENGGYIEVINTEKDQIIVTNQLDHDQIQAVVRTKKSNEWVFATENILSFFTLNTETKQIKVSTEQAHIRDICCIQEISNDLFVLAISYERNLKVFDRNKNKVIQEIKNFSKNGIYHNLLKITKEDNSEFLILKDKEEVQLIDCELFRTVTIAQPDYQAPEMFKNSLTMDIEDGNLIFLTLEHYKDGDLYKRTIQEAVFGINTLNF